MGAKCLASRSGRFILAGVAPVPTGWIPELVWKGQSREYRLASVSDWLRAGRSGDRIPVGARFFAHFQTGSGAHPVSYTMVFPGVKRQGRGADHPPLLEPRSKISRAIPLLPLWVFGPCYI
jgi:hypothetical protein